MIKELGTNSPPTTKSNTEVEPLTIGVAIITHCAKWHLPHCLPPLLNSPLKPRVLVTNSSSCDGTVELAEELGAETLVFPRNEFNHGLTRERARKFLGTDIVIMMTPDAYPTDHMLLSKLIHPLVQKKASVAYARQIPHHGAGFFEAFAREFNYPQVSHIRSIKDVNRYGIYTFFCSDSCAAYDNRALESIGGFSEVLIGEDTVAVAKLLHQGHKIAYVADALVRHSHDYSLWQDFQRHFDTGLARKSYCNLLSIAGRDEKRGLSYTLTLLKRLFEESPRMIPYALAQTTVKMVGYRLGKWADKWPASLKEKLSGQGYYWKT